MRSRFLVVGASFAILALATACSHATDDPGTSSGGNAPEVAGAEVGLQSRPPDIPGLCLLQHPASWTVNGVTCLETMFAGLPRGQYLQPGEVFVLVAEGDGPYASEGSVIAICNPNSYDPSRPQLRFVGPECEARPGPYLPPGGPGGPGGPGPGPEEP